MLLFKRILSIFPVVVEVSLTEVWEVEVSVPAGFKSPTEVVTVVGLFPVLMLNALDKDLPLLELLVVAIVEKDLNNCGVFLLIADESRLM